MTLRVVDQRELIDEIHLVESEAEAVGEQREEVETIFESLSPKMEALNNLLASVLKALQEMQWNIVRCMESGC